MLKEIKPDLEETQLFQTKLPFVLTLLYRVAFLAGMLVLHYLRIYVIPERWNTPDPAFLTIWAKFATTLSALLNILWSFSNSQAVYPTKFICGLFRTSFCMQFIVVALYFPIVHPEIHTIYSEPIELSYVFWLHTYPFLGQLGEVINSNVVFRMDGAKTLLLLMVCYLATNLYYTVSLGRAVYPVFDWKDYISGVIITGTVIIIFALHGVMSTLTASRRNPGSLKEKTS